MGKLWFSGFTMALAMAMAGGLAPQEPAKEKGGSGETAPKAAEAPAKDDPVRDLGEVYRRLKVLRSQKLAETPRRLADDAARLYRQAIEANAAKDAEKTRALILAARGLTNALELSLGDRDARSAEDPDLPPPPARGSQMRTVIVGPARVQGLPPALSGDEAKGPATPAKPGEARGVVIGPERVFLVRPDGGQAPGREIIVEKIQRDEDGRINALEEARRAAEQARKEAEALRKSLMEERQKAIEAQRKAMLERSKAQDQADGARKAIEELPRIELQLKEVETLKRAEADAALKERLAGLERLAGFDRLQKYTPVQGRLGVSGVASDASREAALAALKDAYDQVSAARKAGKESQDAPYLDAARNLYNSARREAEAGRFARAVELSRAAVSLVEVPRALSRVRSSRTVTGSRILSRTPDDGPAKDTVRVEVRVDDDDLKKAQDAKEGADTPLAGVGVTIEFVSGKARVTGLVADGPAMKDGRLKSGDSLVGIETDSGAIVGFGDKTLEEATKLLRGPAGSKVKILVQPEGSADRKVYEIERNVLHPPAPEPSKAKEESPKPSPAQAPKGEAIPPAVD